jgi:hypothetical protein
MASRSETRKRRLTPTQARAARRARRAARRKWLRYGGGTAALAVAAAFIVSLFLPGLPFGRSGGGHDPAAGGAEAPGIRMASQGTTHIGINESHPPDNSQPATSGWHYEGSGISYAGGTISSPAPWAIYNDEIPDEVLIHNLEHGGVRIHYNCPEGCSELISQLADSARLGSKIILSPYTNMESRIALAAWNYIDAFDEYDEGRIREFIAAHESSANAPEWNVP